MAVFRIAGFADGLAFADVDAVPAASGEGFVVESVTYQNLSLKPMFFDIKRSSGQSIASRTVNPGQALTTLNAQGSVSNRTALSVSASWGEN